MRKLESVAVYELEVVEGLESLAAAEVQQLLLGIKPPHIDQGALRILWAGDSRRLHHLRLTQAAYRSMTFEIPRPRALLGDQHFKRLVAAIGEILSAADGFKSLGIDAAGSQSRDMQRIRHEVASAVGLEPADEARGDLLLRIRPSQFGWEVLIRLTPRPLATRPWRVRNYPAALNACVAHAMAILSQPKPDDAFINLCCGSGSILVERLSAGPAAHALGIDHDPAVLELAKQNVQAAGHDAADLLALADATATGLPGGSVSALAADLPFGQHSGSIKENEQLYPALLAESARIATPSARFVVITHAIRQLETALSTQNMWHVRQTIKVTLRGLHPRIYVLKLHSDSG